MKIACIGNYPPRECGIATFTFNLISSIIQNLEVESVFSSAYIIAMNDHDNSYDYPEEVKFEIRQDQPRDYLNAAKYINYSDADVCILEHEFGIFGGSSGVFILPLIHRLEKPLIVTFHTILREPSFSEKAIIQEIGRKASKIVVMSNRAITFLKNIYNIPEEKIALFEHGVPNLDLIENREFYKKKFKIENNKTLFTFGLLSRNKGIETVIQALPKVVEKHPDLLYIVLGKTHPHVIRASGEEYRNFLMRLARKFNIEKNVYFYKQFVSEKELFEYLSAIDIYVTPYLNEAQITSGTLAYAMGAGAAVLSTPYWHAQELLADSRGRLFDFRDSERLTEILTQLFDDPVELKKLRKRSYDYGRGLLWKNIGGQYLELAQKVQKDFVFVKDQKGLIVDPLLMPKYTLAHIKRLTDDTGIIQHAKYGIPNLKEGYCLDDNTRALLFTLMAHRLRDDKEVLELLPIYLSYIHYLQNDDGTFKNFLSFDRRFLDDVGSEDAFGRAIFALGFLIKFAPSDAYLQLAKEIFGIAFQNFEKLTSIRGIANTIVGISFYLNANQSDEGMIKVLKNLYNKMVDEYEKTSSEEWDWFELTLTYDNGMLPFALFRAYEITGEEKILDIAKRTLQFLDHVTFRNGYLTPVGSNGWFEKGGECARYAQQAIDVMAMVLVYYQAFVNTKNEKYLSRMFTSYLWFLGENDLRLPLYDYETKGCCDGLEVDKVNRNQGAESTLAYWISHVTVLHAHQFSHKVL